MLEQDSQKMKWKLALRIATSPSHRWQRKAADWNPELSTRYNTNSSIGRPRKRWEDDINEFLKQEVEGAKQNGSAQNRGMWTLPEENSHTVTVLKNYMTKDAAVPKIRTARINNLCIWEQQRIGIQ